MVVLSEHVMPLPIRLDEKDTNFSVSVGIVMNINVKLVESAEINWWGVSIVSGIFGFNWMLYLHLNKPYT